MGNNRGMNLGGDRSVTGEPANQKIKAYYDGKCPMCSAIADRVRNSDRSDLFDLRDMHKERSMPFNKAAVEKEMHVVDREGNTHRGAEAIFRITEQYPRLRLATRIARASPISALAPIVYRLIAANRRFIVGQASRIYWLKTSIIVAFCLGLLLSPHLWAGPRTYPATPIFSALPVIDSYLAYGLFAALFALAAMILVSPRPQKFIAAFLAIISVFCLLDQTRWQPWVFQYSFLLVTLALFSWRSDDVDGLKQTINTARLVHAPTYFPGFRK
jgi:predicted DCC family thiol-disulfide oxidoreductase YuxK